jgi:hypothetical protein
MDQLIYVLFSPVQSPEACKIRDAVNVKKAIIPKPRSGVLVPLFMLLARADSPKLTLA